MLAQRSDADVAVDDAASDDEERLCDEFLDLEGPRDNGAGARYADGADDDGCCTDAQRAAVSARRRRRGHVSVATMVTRHGTDARLRRQRARMWCAAVDSDSDATASGDSARDDGLGGAAVRRYAASLLATRAAQRRPTTSRHRAVHRSDDDDNDDDVRDAVDDGEGFATSDAATQTLAPDVATRRCPGRRR